MKLRPAARASTIGRVLLVEVAHGLVTGVAPEGRVVERDLGVQERQPLDRSVRPVLAHDGQRVDLDEVGVLADHDVDQASADGHGLREVLAEAEGEGHLARLEGLQAQLRVGVDAHDGVRVLLRERLDLHAALRGAHEQDALLGAVQDGSQVQLAHDGGRRGDHHAAHGDALDVHAQDGRRDGFRLVRAACQLDATGLASATHEDLGLDDDGTGAAIQEGGRLGACLGRRRRHRVGWDRQAGTREQGLGVVFVELHGLLQDSAPPSPS